MKSRQARLNRARNFATVVALFLAAAIVLPGCLWAPLRAQIRLDLERQLPGASFDKEFEISLGPVSLAFARMVTRLVPDAHDASGYLKNVRKIEVAVYNAHQMPPVDQVKMPERMQSMIEKDGWETAIRVREENEIVWVMYRTDDESVKNVCVVVLNDDELVMVRAEGNLEQLVALALEQNDMPSIPYVNDYN